MTISILMIYQWILLLLQYINGGVWQQWPTKWREKMMDEKQW